jgi:F-type H+-transporting ATPase subunit epsilon
VDLKILLPFMVFLVAKDIREIVIETSVGSYGILPQRLDGVAALVPGILTYKTGKGTPQYLAVDAGVLIKAGNQVLVSVRNAIGGANLGELGEKVKKDFSNQDAAEKKVKALTVKLESGFLYSFDIFRRIE